MQLRVKDCEKLFHKNFDYNFIVTYIIFYFV